MSRRVLLVVGGGASYAISTPPPSTLYMLFNGTADASLYAIGAATSSDSGQTWTPFASNPVLQVGSGWDGSTVKDPCLLWNGSQYVCYYAGYDGTNYAVGRATASAHTGTWFKAGGNPLISKGSGGAFDDAGVRFPTVLYEPTDTGKEWKCWYGADKSGGEPSIGYAYSTDGLTWTKVGQVLTKGAGGTWEDEGVYPFGIYKSGATYYLFYGGYQSPTNPRWQGGYATFTDPAGTYTKGGGNPTLLARFNTAGTSQLLTATTLAGTAVVTVADTSAWHVGESMAIADGGVETDIRTIASIDSGTQITFSAVTANAFDNSGGTIRPFAYNSVVPRTILSDGAGGFVMYGTPFQPVEDLSPGGTKLREGSLRWTSSSLTGTWSYDYTAGLLLPITLTGWAAKSSENPSVIAAP